MKSYTKDQARKSAIKYWKKFHTKKSNSTILLEHLSRWLQSNTKFKRILTTIPFQFEVDVLFVLLQFKKLELYIPQTKNKGVMVFRRLEYDSNLNVKQALGTHGVPGPPSRAQLFDFPFVESDLIIVPGLAANSKGFRLGRGGGYYDRFLKEKNVATTLMLLPSSVCNIGFEAQEHDIAVDMILTEGDVFVF